MDLNSDFVDLLRLLNAADARYLIVGAHALAYYARPRATADFDVWIDASPENAARVYRALADFGAPLDALGAFADLSDEGIVFQIGVAPVRIDILTGIDGVTFQEAWPRRTEASMNGTDLFIIGRDDLIPK